MPLKPLSQRKHQPGRKRSLSFVVYMEADQLAAFDATAERHGMTRTALVNYLLANAAFLLPPFPPTAPPAHLVE